MQATMYGMSCEIVNECASALSYNASALKHLQGVKSPNLCCALTILILGRLGTCYHNTYDWSLLLLITSGAIEMLLRAIREYEKYQGQISLSHPATMDDSALEGIDKAMLNILVKFPKLPISMDRLDELPPFRRQARRLVRSSKWLHIYEQAMMDSFDDTLALFIMHERRYKRERGLAVVKLWNCCSLAKARNT
ncbi:hypothetical protein GN244_ATG10898 [Phytophthora infestans]|uniref:Uncharacterized protein n=1 Tax=Phytophthora infestans TaxID=4787 RepID=A0A833SS82_PHYIN|nr:hypothetical protein GN244_ATG10898 [Phytophthora infestans]KAF4132040.1 hypothetical protein GN958_ATG18761 [Phytophthora infestans]